MVPSFDQRLPVKPKESKKIPADDLLPRVVSPAALASPGRPPGSARTPLWFASIAIVIAGLYLARDVLIPLLLSMLLSFLLVPVVSRLRRWGLGRVSSVLATMVMTVGLVVALGAFFLVQLADVSMRLPEYQETIEKKIQSVRVAPDGPFGRAMRAFTTLTKGIEKATAAQDDEAADPGEIDAKAANEKAASAKVIDEKATIDKAADPSAAHGKAIDEKATDDKAIDAKAIDAKADDEKLAAGVEAATPKMQTVRIVSEGPTPMSMLRNVMGSAASALATAGIVFVLVIFMLLEREALRDRVISLIGTAPGQINITTQAIDDAAQRVSRYLFMQLIVNVTYGVPIGIGLYFIGVPNAALWGIFAIVLRFIPFLGPVIAASFPIALSFAVDPGWGMAVQTLLLFVVVEIISNNFIETWLYGTSMGISVVAILMSALFWTWLWGPIGLLMSMPMTVCLMVMGRYIPGLSGLSLLLGDQPGLPLYARVYQRFLAMDPDEPDHIAMTYLKDHTVEEFFDQVLLPAMRLLEDERYQESLEPVRRAFVLEHICDLIESLADQKDPDPADLADANPDAATAGSLVPPAAGAVVPPITESSPASVPEGAIHSDAEVVAPSPDGKASESLATLAPETSPVVVCIPAHDESDEIVAQMVSTLLRRRGVASTVIPASMRAVHRVEQLAASGAPIVCVSVLPPFAAVYARHMVQRIQTSLPRSKTIVGFWESSAISNDLNHQLIQTGATEVVSSLAHAVKSLLALVATLPVVPPVESVALPPDGIVHERGLPPQEDEQEHPLETAVR